MGSRRVVDQYDLVIFDLDGVIYLGDQVVPKAPAAVARLRRDGIAVAFATNNASRRPYQVADILNAMDVAARTEEVFTSARAAASALAGLFPPGSPVLVVGAQALRDEVAEVGLTVVDSADELPVAVVQGYGPQVGWAQLAEACVAIRAGAVWVATNTDATLPTPRGPLPGNGSLVMALAHALGRSPDHEIGKPQPTLFVDALAAAGARRALVVGDRLDTDIAGAHRAGMDSLLVLTGVNTARDAELADAEQRPTYVADDLDGLWEKR